MRTGEKEGRGSWRQRGDTQRVCSMANKEESGDCCGFLASSLEIKISQVSQTSFDRRSPFSAVTRVTSELLCSSLLFAHSCLCAFAASVQMSLARRTLSSNSFGLDNGKNSIKRRRREQFESNARRLSAERNVGLKNERRGHREKGEEIKRKDCFRRGDQCQQVSPFVS